MIELKLYNMTYDPFLPTPVEVPIQSDYISKERGIQVQVKSNNISGDHHSVFSCNQSSFQSLIICQQRLLIYYLVDFGKGLIRDVCKCMKETKRVCQEVIAYKKELTSIKGILLSAYYKMKRTKSVIEEFKDLVSQYGDFQESFKATNKQNTSVKDIEEIKRISQEINEIIIHIEKSKASLEHSRNLIKRINIILQNPYKSKTNPLVKDKKDDVGLVMEDMRKHGMVARDKSSGSFSSAPYDEMNTCIDSLVRSQQNILIKHLKEQRLRDRTRE